MDTLDLRNLQLSYQAVYDGVLCESMEELGIIGEARDGYGDEIYDLYEGAAGNVADRAQRLANQRKGQTPERKKMYQDLAYKARERERTGDLMGASRFERSRAYGPQITPASSQRASETETLGGGTYTRGPKRKPKGKKYKRQVQSGVRAASSQEKKRLGIKESLDYYDMILEYLLDEGYADTVENAEAIMVNMSEEWVGDIMEEKKKSKKKTQEQKDAETREKWYGKKAVEAGTDRFSQLQKAALKSARTRLF